MAEQEKEFQESLAQDRLVRKEMVTEKSVSASFSMKKEEKLLEEARLANELELAQEMVLFSLSSLSASMSLTSFQLSNRRKRALARLGLEPPRGSADSTELVRRCLPNEERLDLMWYLH